MSISETLKTASAPLTKLIDAVSNAIGKAYEPRYIRKMADAKAYEIKRIAEEVRNNSDLPIVYNGTGTVVDISDFEELRKRTGNRLAYQEMLKQENIESVVDKAYDELDGKELQSDEEISPEWMNRFINMAGEISTEEMQNIWAKVLAGEVIKPSSYSMRTLECLRNLSVKDAELFGKIANYVINDHFVYNDDEINKRYNIPFGEILTLNDCGLINSSGFISLDYRVNKRRIMIFDFKEYLFMARSDNDTIIKIDNYPLTRAGRELLTVARSGIIENHYIKDVMASVERQYVNVHFSLHRVTDRYDNEINYEEKEMDRN